MKKLITYTVKEGKKLRLEIEKDEFAGYYLYVYSAESDKSVADYLQDTLEITLEVATEMFGVKKEDWKPIE